MTISRKIEIESLSFFLLAAAAGIAFAFYFNHGPKIRTVFNLPVANYAQTTPTPTPAPIPKVETFSQPSPDGAKMLTMVITPNKTTSKTYVFSVTDADKTTHQIYSVNLPIDETMSIPFNTFSPDNKFIFVDHNTRNGTEAFVFRANGDQMAENVQYYNATALFAAKQTGNNYQTTTGWASETLLIINTTHQDGSKGPSYWLEIPSKALIPLATEF